MHSGIYYFYFEGARKELSRTFAFNFIDDQQPFTQIWDPDISNFRDMNVVRIKTRALIAQPYLKLDINDINNGDENAEMFQYSMSSFTKFQKYRVEIWAETKFGEGPSIITQESFHFITAQIES